VKKKGKNVLRGKKKVSEVPKNGVIRELWQVHKSYEKLLIFEV